MQAHSKSVCNECFLLILGALLMPGPPAVACSCHAYPACVYVSQSDVIFLGKVTFSNDDGSGTFVQATLVRFEVQEIFKGLAADVREVWVDPGSFTSCYAEYKVGQRYLVFGSSQWDFSHTIAATVVNGPGRRKPAPPGFDLKKPPRVYLSPECSGTREVGSSTEDVVSSDPAFLRAWKEGKSTTRVYGRVLDHHSPAWPQSNPPALQGATLILKGAGQQLMTVSDSEGGYSFDGIAPGQYSLDITMAGYRSFPQHTVFDLARGACGYTEVDMVTDGSFQGIVRDHIGRGLAGVEMRLERLLPDGELDFIGSAITDERGAFLFSDVPTGDFYLGVNIDHPPTVSAPYPPFYFPGTSHPTSIHLNLQERRKGLTLSLPPPLKTRAVEVNIVWADLTPVPRADVWAFYIGGELAEHAQTDESGRAKLICLRDFPYQVEATKWLPGSSPTNPIKAQSERFTLPRGSQTGVMKVVLAKASR